MVRCAKCKNSVQPRLSLEGIPQCPLCHADMGGRGARPVMAGGRQPRPAGAPRAEGAVASLVLGILAVVTWLLALVLAPIAIVLGVKARRRIRESQHRLEGGGMAMSGIVLGIAGLVLIPVYIVIAAVVFVLVQGVGGTIAEDEVALAGDESYTQAFEVYEDATVHFEIDGLGDGVYAAIVNVDDPQDPDPVWDVPPWAEAQGERFEGSVDLAPGDYGLYLECMDRSPCRVSFSIELS